MSFISLRSSLSRKQKKEWDSSIATWYLLLLGGLYQHKISAFSSLTAMSEPANADVGLSQIFNINWERSSVVPHANHYNSMFAFQICFSLASVKLIILQEKLTIVDVSCQPSFI